MTELINNGDVMFCAGGFVSEQMSDFIKDLQGEIETVRGLPRTLTLNLIKDAVQIW
jgi:hypothetical protein